MHYLNNTALKIKEKKELNIAYIGGSATQGYGSSNGREKSWPTLVSRWMEETYGIKVNFVNAGIGGTASYLANFRFDTDVAPIKPDLFFIEFAVNDYYEDFDYRTVRRQSESLLAKAYALNPDMDVVYAFTYDLHYDTADYPQLRAHRDVADRNGLLSVKFSDYIYAKCRETGENPHDFYIDWVHPNDYGYKTYAEIVESVLAKELENCKGATKLVSHSLTAVSDGLLTGARLVTGEKAYDLSGWTFEEKGMRYGGHLIAEKPGSTCKVDFEGTDFGLFFNAGENCGKLQFVVDGAERLIVDTYLWHENCKEKPIFTCLAPGKHTVEVTLLEDKNGKSGGNKAEIGAFLVG